MAKRPTQSSKVKKAEAPTKTVRKSTVTTAKKAAAQKTTAQQASRIKSSAKTNTKSAATKPAPKKNSVQKKPAAKTTKSVTSKSRSTQKSLTTAKSTPIVTESTSAKTVKKETIASLKIHVDDLVKKLRRADSDTRRSVKTLEAAFATLESNVKDHQTVNHAALTRRVDQLTHQLTQSVNETRAQITNDLKDALANPTISKLQNAILRSEQNLEASQYAQSQAVSKINHHIADLARIVDERFKVHIKDVNARVGQVSQLENKITSLQSQSYERIRMVEDTTASAMRKLGTDVINTAESFQSKLERQGAEFHEAMARIASQTQRDFESYKSDVANRIQGLSDAQRNLNDRSESELAKINARIDALEYGLSPTQGNENSIFKTAPVEPVSIEQPVHTNPEPTPTLDLAEAHQDAFSDEPIDAFAAADAALMENTPDNSTVVGFPPPQQSPYSQAEIAAYGAQAPVLSSQPAPYEPVAYDPHASTYPAQPVEFNPQGTSAAIAPQHHYVDPAQTGYAMTAPGDAYHDPYSAEGYGSPDQTVAAYQDQNAYQSPAEPVAQPLPAGGPMEYTPETAITDADLPYENPGYGEAQANIVAENGVTRPGHVESRKDSKKRKKKVKKAKVKSDSALASSTLLTKRNLQVAGLAVALATTGYFGLRGFFSEPDTPPPPQQVNYQAPPQNSAPIPNMTDNVLEVAPTAQVDGSAGIVTGTTPLVTSSPSASQTLQQAADSGNAIAQFQLGITYLESGDKDQGLKYIRGAANQGQPAAQYRLAKLYEAGVGVTTDPNMAKELTERAALAGNRVAMHDLGLYYALGLGETQVDMSQALTWFEKAAERGVVDSQFNLGMLYSSNEGVPVDLTTSYVWFSIASKQGDQFAKDKITNIGAKLSPEELDQANRRIAQFKPTAINEEANGIFRDVPWVMPDTNAMVASAELVKDAQVLLGQLGYDVGAPDGDMGPKTRAAVKAFERANGMDETGRVSASLVDRLQAAAGV